MSVPEIEIDELVLRRDDGAAVLDVRNPDEWEEVRIPGVVLVPLSELPERLDEVPTDEPVLVVCRSGGRSQRACELLRSAGVDAVNVAGGTLAWVEAGHETEHGPAAG